MDKRAYFLLIISFLVAFTEFIVSGILDLVADNFQIEMGKAGLLITVFSFLFALFSPILFRLVSKGERKRWLILSLLVFLVGNMMAAYSPNYGLLLIARIFTAFGGLLLMIASFVSASEFLPIQDLSRMTGLISAGIGGAMVIGLPTGLIIAHTIGWRAPFVFISVFTAVLLAGIVLFMDKVESRSSVIKAYPWIFLRNRKLFYAHLSTFFYMVAHGALFSYLKPFIQTVMGLDETWAVIIYFFFGIAAVSGAGMGTSLADMFGVNKTLLFLLLLFGVTFFSIPFVTSSVPGFLIAVISWGTLSWALSPVMRSYLAETSPESVPFHHGFHYASHHFGIAVGSLVGGMVINQYAYELNATIGGLFIFLSLITVLISVNHQRFFSGYENMNT